MALNATGFFGALGVRVEKRLCLPSITLLLGTTYGAGLVGLPYNLLEVF